MDSIKIEYAFNYIITMALVGSVHGEVKPHSFTVKLSDLGVGQGSFIKVSHDNCGWVLAQIESTRRYKDALEDVTLGKARTIGYEISGKVLMPHTPFKTDEKVYTADQDLITKVLGLRKSYRNSIYLGFIDGTEIPAYLDVKKTLGKHFSVLAKTGAGKSYAVAVILEDLLKSGMPLVIIDPHGEYSSLKVENDDYDLMLKYNVKINSYESQLTEYSVNQEANPDSRKLSLKPQFEFHELLDIMPLSLNDKQKHMLYSSLKVHEDREYDLEDLMNIVRLERSSVKWKVVSGLEYLKSSRVFEGRPITEKELVKENHASIINLKGAEPQIQQLVVAKIAKDLFNARRLNKIPEFLLLVEEAHNFCPERGVGTSISSSIMRSIASEGRKFGLHLGVVSQRPARIDKNVLSQCSTQIILKVTNPNDLKAIGQSIEGFTAGLEEDIKRLPVGHALIVGPVEQPITVSVRARETKHGIKPRAKPKEDKKIPKQLKPNKKEEKRKGLLYYIKKLFIKEKKSR